MSLQGLNPEIFDTLLEPTFLLDHNLKVVYCNEAAATLCEVSKRRLLKLNSLMEAFQFSEPVAALENLSQRLDPSPYQEVRFQTPTGKEGRVQITVQPFLAGAQWLLFFRDVTLEETLQKKYRAELEAKEDTIEELRQAQKELKNYSENLEKMVAERTAELAHLNQLMGALLDSLEQGFFLFDVQENCLDVFSKACLRVIEGDPRGKKIQDVLKLKETERLGFSKWLKTLFSEMLPFPDLAPLGPQRFPHSLGLQVKLDYYPVRGPKGIEAVVVVASDISSLVAAEETAAREKNHVQMILKLIGQKRQVAGFLQESQAQLRGLREQFQKAQPDSQELFRLYHTLKGGSASFGVQSVAELCHIAESQLATGEGDLDLRAQLPRIEKAFADFLSENAPVLGDAVQRSERWVEVPVSRVASTLSTAAGMISEIKERQRVQDLLHSALLLEPIESHLQRYQEISLQLAERLEKLVDPPSILGGETLILPEAYSGLLASLVHLYRNAIDHGIEAPSVREQAGKKIHGTLTTTIRTGSTAEFSGLVPKLRQIPSPRWQDHAEWLSLEVTDDGGGIDANRLRTKLSPTEQQLPDQEVLQVLFRPNFSTRTEVTETSGRGVGTDAVLQEALRLGGTAFVESTLSKGSRFVVLVPYVRELPQTTTAPALRAA